MSCAALLIAASALAGVASAQPSGTSIFYLEASADGGRTFSPSIALGGDPAGYAVQVRVGARLLDPSGVYTFGGTTYQPTLNGWNPATDSRLPFTNANGTGGPETPSFLGRIFPFASVGQTTSSASGLLTPFVDAGTTLRFAGANLPTPLIDPRWGVISAQLAFQLETGVVTFDAAIFKFGVHVTPGEAVRTLIADVPRAYMPNGGRMTWFTRPDGTSSYLATLDHVETATITLAAVPAPATVLLVLVAPAVLRNTARSRRPRALSPLETP